MPSSEISFHPNTSQGTGGLGNTNTERASKNVSFQKHITCSKLPVLKQAIKDCVYPCSRKLFEKVRDPLSLITFSIPWVFKAFCQATVDFLF